MNTGEKGRYQIIEISSIGDGRIAVRSCVGLALLDRAGLPLVRTSENKTKPIEVADVSLAIEAAIKGLIRNDVHSVFIISWHGKREDTVYQVYSRGRQS